MLLYELSDVQWAFVEHFISAVKSARGRPPGDHRRVFAGVLWVADTASPWRKLPRDYGHWCAVFRQYQRWTQAGLWEVMLMALRDEAAAKFIVSTENEFILDDLRHAPGSARQLARLIEIAEAIQLRGKRPVRQHLPVFYRER